MLCYRWENDDLLLSVLIQPRARKAGIIGIHENRLKIKITEPPIDGAANEAVIKLLSKLFDVNRSHIYLEKGQTAREKLFRIQKPHIFPEILNNQN